MNRHLPPCGQRPNASYFLHPHTNSSPLPPPFNPHLPVPSPINLHRPPTPSPINPHLITEPLNHTINLFPSAEYEQRLRDEVIYLHSLWRQGPPRNPTTARIAPQNPYLKPSTFISFKRKKNKRRDHTESMLKQRSVYEKEWPVNSPPPPEPSSFDRGWAPFKSPSEATTWPASEEERTRVFALRLQRKFLDPCVEFFEDEDDEDDEEDEDGDDIEDCREFEFFLTLFKENNVLTAYYEKNWENGEFLCLVCAASEAKAGRTYKGTIGLVLHSIQIAKTKRKRAHRAYGHVICKVHGWDIKSLPTIVVVGDTLSQSLEKSDGLQGAAKTCDHGVENALYGTKGDNNPSNAEDCQLVSEATNVADKKDDTAQETGKSPRLDTTTNHFEANFAGGSDINTQECCP